MKRIVLGFILLLAVTITGTARHQVLVPNIKTLQVVVNQEWTSLPVMVLGSDDVLNVAFDELSHNYHRFIVHIERCEPDWTENTSLFESDWMEGFNDQPIEDYENSLNTTVQYTHYRLQIPNEYCHLKMSGNYRLRILDDDNDRQAILQAEFRIVEPLMNIGLSVTTNTDVDMNKSHQQVNMNINYNDIRVTNFEEQIQTFLMQNSRDDNMKANIRPTYITPKGVRWEHCRHFIFEAGNEYHKFEMLDPSHTTMGLGHITWDEATGRYHAYPFFCEPQRGYTYDEDADGAFYVRNSDNIDNDITSDYIYVHYLLKPYRPYEYAHVIIDGNWTTEQTGNYMMTYNEETKSYEAVILQKMGYYNYQLLMKDADGITHRMPEEGSFYQTENRYQAFVYYKGTGERTWRLLGYQYIFFR